MRVARSCKPETLQARIGQKDRVHLAVVELAQPRVDIAAQQDDLEIGPQPRHLRVAAHRTCPDARALGQFGKRLRLVRDETLRSDLRAPGTRVSVKAGGRSVGTSFIEWTARSISSRRQRVFQFLDEQSLAAGIGKRAILDAVAGGLEDRRSRRRWPFASSAERTISACTSASLEPRVPRRRVRFCGMTPKGLEDWREPIKGRHAFARTDRSGHRDELRRNRRRGGARLARRARAKSCPTSCSASSRSIGPMAAWCRRSPRAPMSKSSTGSSTRRLARRSIELERHRCRGGDRRPRTDRRRDGRTDDGQGAGAGGRKAADRRQSSRGTCADRAADRWRRRFPFCCC